MPSFVQTANSGSPSGTATSKTAVYASAQTVGNLNVVVISFGKTAGTITNLITSVSDTLGNTYSAANTFLTGSSSGSDNLGQIIYYSPNIRAAGAGANTVTVTLSAASSFFAITILEESGLALTSPIDVTSSAQANQPASSTANSGSLTTTNASDTLVGAIAFFDGPNATPNITAGFTQRASFYTTLVADRVVSSTGSYSFQATAAAGGDGWVAQLVAFKAASATTLHFPMPIADTSSVTLGFDNNRHFPFAITGTSSITLGFHNNRHFPLAITDTSTVTLGFHNTRHFPLAITDTSSAVLTFRTGGTSLPSFVQTANSGISIGTATSQSATFSSAQIAGDCNVVLISYGNASGSTIPQTILSVADTSGNTYAPLTSFRLCVSGASTALGQIIYAAPNIKASGAGNIVTVTTSAAVSYFAVTVLEYSGIALSSPLDVTIENAQSQPAALTGTTGALTTTQANDALIGSLCFFDAPASGPSSGFTQRASFYTTLAADQLAIPIGTYTLSATAGGADGWVAQMIALKASGAPPPLHFPFAIADTSSVVLRFVGSAHFSLQIADQSHASLTFSVASGTSFVQSAHSASPGGATLSSTAVTFSSAQTLGNCNVVIISYGNGSGSIIPQTILSVVDTKGNSYAPLTTFRICVSEASTALGQIIYVAPNILAAPAGTNTVTVTTSAAVSYFSVTVLEYSGVVPSSPLDVAIENAQSQPSASIASTGALTTANANDILVGALCFFDGPASGPSAGFTQRTSFYTTLAADQNVYSTGSYTLSGTSSGVGGWIAQMLALKSSTSVNLHFPFAVQDVSHVLLGFHIPSFRFPVQSADTSSVFISFHLATGTTGGNWFVRPSGGTGTGKSWSAAWTLTQLYNNWVSVLPGDTVWIAGGNYPDAMGITCKKSGTSSAPISVLRATVNDLAATGSQGWLPSYDAQAIIQGGINFPGPISYVTVSGRTPSGFYWASDSSGGDGSSGGIATAYGSGGPMTGIILAYYEMTGAANTTGNNGPTYGINWVPTGGQYAITNCLVDHCWAHHMSETVRCNHWNHVIVQYSTFGPTNNFGDHADLAYVYSSDTIVWRYNYFYASPGDGLYHQFGPNTNIWIYGNVWYDCDGDLISVGNVNGGTEGPYFIYNNVFGGVSGGTSQVAFSSPSGTFSNASQLFNNIFYLADWSVGTAAGHFTQTDYNAYNPTSFGTDGGAHSFTFANNPFVDVTTGNFRFTSAALAAPFAGGFTLAPVSGQTLNQDMAGNTRGFPWYLGAFQYASGIRFQLQVADTSHVALTFEGAIVTQRFPLQVADTSAVALTWAAGTASNFVQTANSGAPVGSALSKSVTFPRAQTVGNLNAVIISFGKSNGVVTNTITSVTDSSGNVYTPSNAFLSCVAIGNDTLGQIIYHCANIKAALAGANTLTVTLSAAAPFFAVTVVEEAGLALTNPIDGTASAEADLSANSVTGNTGPLTTTNANDVLLGAIAFYDGPYSAPNITGGFTQRASFYTTLVADQLVFATGTYSLSAAAGGPSGWVAQLVAYKLPGPPPQLHFPFSILDTSRVTLGFHTQDHFPTRIIDTSTVRLSFHIGLQYGLGIADTSRVRLSFTLFVLSFPIDITSASAVRLSFSAVTPPAPIVPLNPFPPYSGVNQPANIEVTADIAWRESQREEGCWVIPPYQGIFPEVENAQTEETGTDSVPPPISKTDLWSSMQTWPL